MKHIYGEISEKLLAMDKILILTHENPDGDAIGTVAGTIGVLRDSGKDAVAFFPEALPARYSKIVDPGLFTYPGTFSPADYSCVLCLDITSFERVAAPPGIKLESMISIIVDHHPDNKMQGNFNYIDSSASSTGEIIFKSFCASDKWRISAVSAGHFLAALLTDTGCFRFDNTKPDSLNCAADLVRRGADYGRIINGLYFSKPLNIVRFESEVISTRLNTDLSGKYAWTWIDDPILEKHGMRKSDTEELIDILRALDGVEIACILYRNPKGVKFSLRSKNRRYSVGKIARKFGGGGHEMASGGLIPDSEISAASDLILNEVKKTLNGNDD